MGDNSLFVADMDTSLLPVICSPASQFLSLCESQSESQFNGTCAIKYRRRHYLVGPSLERERNPVSLNLLNEALLDPTELEGIRI
jgi:hypothetical protein